MKGRLYCTKRAILALAGRPRFRFSPMGTVFAADGGLQCFNLIPIPTTCLHI